MSIAPILRPRVLVMFAVALILSVSAYGFAAANTFTNGPSGAGDGNQAISGFAISSVAYTMDASSPSNITSVAFDITPATGAAAAKTVKIKLFALDSFHTCDAITTPGSAVCDLGAGVATTAADLLRVVASS
ncbi:MAG: hypothetical protein ABIV47_07765 [Roseiflexaceae bacterium]